MAEGMLRRLLTDNGAHADVGSAGLLRGGAPATRHAIAVMADRGVDISRHVSQTIDPEVVRSTPLIIGMAREHVREAVVGYGADIEHTFTLKELVRRGERTGPRRLDETVFDWLARVAAGRRSADLMGEDHDDDIPDPVGRSRAHYEATARELDVLLRWLVQFLIGGPARSASYASSSPSRPVGGETRYATGGG
jgi:protein-tyrosine-phosphatase